LHETPEDLAALTRLLDSSHRAGGEHLLSIFTDERRVPASELCALLRGVCVLALATTTAAGEPRVAPVDGLFYRGAWHFGSSKTSVRYAHLVARPAVSGSHTRGEELAVIVHGRATFVDVDAPEHAGFRSVLIETYGPDWEDWAPSQNVFYARIDAERMYTFRMPASG
jgi:uncharacterized pyridoxamine 5'-phosphate oxidase family protein